MIFKNRTEAGEKLARQVVRAGSLADPLVLALPRGGLPVAVAVARRLNAPLDVLVVRKVGAPGNEEFGIGAVTENSFYWMNPEIVSYLGVSKNQQDELIESGFKEVQRRVNKYRGGRSLPDLRGRSVIIVDDGIATGATAAVAIEYVKNQGARDVIFAAPTGAKESVSFLRSRADQVICLDTPEEFSAVGLWYEDFRQVEDEDVLNALKSVSKPFEGELEMPKNARGVVLFAHGSGSSRFSPRNQKVARELYEAGFGVLLFDLLSEEEASERSRVFDIPFLADRLFLATKWVRNELESRGLKDLPIGYFGASTGAAAALWAASFENNPVAAVVSRGGRPDLALPRLNQVKAPTLLIVGSADSDVVEMNREALSLLHHGRLVLVPGATHLFEEPGALEQVAQHARDWFSTHLGAGRKAA